jgi:hypothetical protein
MQWPPSLHMVTMRFFSPGSWFLVPSPLYAPLFALPYRLTGVADALLGMGNTAAALNTEPRLLLHQLLSLR